MNEPKFLGLRWRIDKRRRGVVGVILIFALIGVVNALAVASPLSNKRLGMGVFAVLAIFGIGILLLFKITMRSWLLWFWLLLLASSLIWVIWGIANNYL